MTASRILVVLALAAAVAFAQPLQVNIPFAFGAVNRTYEPGDYLVKLELGNKSLRFHERDLRTNFVVTGNMESLYSRWGSEPRYYLTFHKYGDRHFLHSVVRSDVTATVTMSRAERELVTSRVVAERRPVIVIVAARIR
jgi:hypothetical protein